ncbi:MAG: hypothetical protein MRY79_02320, partial [Alphaproteobacteria bacterium]|nr:hypothetical protein [Alphaproteobacteria bacterium]
RVINNVKGASTVFQKVGKGTASTKSTHVYKRSEDKKLFSSGFQIPDVPEPTRKPSRKQSTGQYEVND